MNNELHISTDTLKLGFVGLGWIGCSRMKSLKESGMVGTAILTDISEEQTNKITLTDGNCLVCRSVREMIDMKPDGIVIATPNAFHTEQVCEVLEAGIPVFCQKPLGRNFHETHDAISKAEQKNCLLGIDMSYRYLEAVRCIHEVLQRGEIGEIYAVEAIFHNAYGPDKEWFYKPELSGGGCLLDLGVHLIDLVLWLLGFGEVREISGKLFCGGEKYKKNKHIVEDYATVNMEFLTGCNVNISCSWNIHAGANAIIKLDFHGKKGGLSLYNMNGSFYDFRAEKYKGTFMEVLCSPPDDWGGRAIKNWALKLLTDNKFDKSICQIEKTALIIDTVYDNAG